MIAQHVRCDAIYYMWFHLDVQNEALTLVQDPPVEEAKPGERLRWNCTFGQSRPPANIVWIVNGEPVFYKTLTSTNTRSSFILPYLRRYYSRSLFLLLSFGKHHRKKKRVGGTKEGFGLFFPTVGANGIECHNRNSKIDYTHCEGKGN